MQFFSVLCFFHLCSFLLQILSVEIDDVITRRFDAFAAKFGRLYSLDEYKVRQKIFKENIAVVAHLNQNQDGLHSATFSLDDSPFADLTIQEFRSRMLLKRRSSSHIASTIGTNFGEKANDIPKDFDWEAKGAVTSVKDQGALGTCWAFSTMACLEGQLFLKHNILKDLSVEQLVECDSFYDSAHSDCGFFGGWPFIAMQYLIKAGGVRSAEQMPYCSGQGPTCWPCMASGYSKTLCGNHDDLYCNASTTLGQGPKRLCQSTEDFVAAVDSWQAISNNETEIAAALVGLGPLSVCLDASSLQFYKSGIYNPLFCSKTEIDHAVLLVGYGTDNGVDYWRVKNSWNTKWGEKGYFRIVRGKANVP